MHSTDITAPTAEAKIGGRMTLLRFDHYQMRMSEMYWQYSTRGKLGYIGIVDQLVHRTYCGMGAIAYGAVASAAIEAGKEPISMGAFDKAASYDELKACVQTLIRGAMDALPRGNGKGGGRGNA